MVRALGVSVLAATLAACSSVPDVVFVEDDAGTSTPPAPGDGGTSSGSVRDSQAPRPVYACPDKPPPSGVGVCCPGDRICLGCTTAQCERCADQGCRNGDECCAKNPVMVECKSASSCD